MVKRAAQVNEEFSLVLKEIIERWGISLVDLAAHSRITPSYLSNLKQAKRGQPSQRVFCDLLHGFQKLGVPKEYVERLVKAASFQEEIDKSSYYIEDSVAEFLSGSALKGKLRGVAKTFARELLLKKMATEIQCPRQGSAGAKELMKATVKHLSEYFSQSEISEPVWALYGLVEECVYPEQCHRYIHIGRDDVVRGKEEIIRSTAQNPSNFPMTFLSREDQTRFFQILRVEPKEENLSKGERSAMGRAAARKEIVYIPNTSQNDEGLPYFEIDKEVRSSLSIPVVMDEICLAVLSFESCKPDFFHTYVNDFSLEVVASMAGCKLKRLLENREKDYLEMTRIAVDLSRLEHRLNLDAAVKKIAEAMSIQYCSLFLRDLNGGKKIILAATYGTEGAKKRVGEFSYSYDPPFGVTGWVARTMTPIRFDRRYPLMSIAPGVSFSGKFLEGGDENDPERVTLPCLIIPLFDKKDETKIFGVLRCRGKLSQVDEQYFTQADQNLLTHISNYLSQIIQKNEDDFKENLPRYSLDDVTKDLEEGVNQLIQSQGGVFVVHGAQGTGKKFIAKVAHYNTLIYQITLAPFIFLTPRSKIEEMQNALQEDIFATVYIGSLESYSFSYQRELLKLLKGEKENYKKLRVVLSCKDPEQVEKENKIDLALKDYLCDTLHDKGNFLRVPSLKDRKTEIPALVSKFLEEKLQEEVAISAEALRIIIDTTYLWPGNIKEFKTLIGTLCDKVRDNGRYTIDPDDLSPYISS